MISSFTILIADDDPDIREVVALVLEPHGICARGAADGTEAMIELRTHFEISLILLDLMMPRLSGADMMKAMKSDARLAAIPVVVMSGDNTARDTAMAIGARAFLPKPVDLETLLRTIETCLVR